MAKGLNRILFKGKLYSQYYQIGLWDEEAKDSYPLWKTGKEYIVFGIKGVAVATANDHFIDVRIIEGNLFPKYQLCASGEINIGKRGITIGNIVSASIANIKVVKGRYSVTVFTDAIGATTKKVDFFISKLS